MDIKIMVDVVANHMGKDEKNFEDNFPFNKPEHYHDYCLIEDYDFDHN